MNADRLSLGSSTPYRELRGWLDDTALHDSLRALFDYQRTLRPALESQFTARADACDHVSDDALQRLLDAGRDVHGISAQKEISNVIAFRVSAPDTGHHDPALITLRRSVDRRIRAHVRAEFASRLPLRVHCSGHFWYPPGSFMGWHTNSGAPGWRLYLTHVREPHQSCFRYRSPETGEIVTSMDSTWDVRLFRVDAQLPLWHAVHSQTDRFSLGYIIRPWSIPGLTGSPGGRRSPVK